MRFDIVYRFLILFCLMFVIFSSSSFAADEKNQNGTPLKILHDKTNKLLDGLDEKHLRQFRAIRSAHGLIRSLENVRSSLDRAVAACRDNNPDMAEELQQRFVKWKRAIRPHLNAARDKRDDMVILQSFAKPDTVRDYLDSFNKAIAYKRGLFDRQPVNTAEACRDMMDKMNTTQEELVKLLKERLALYDRLQGESTGQDGE